MLISNKVGVVRYDNGTLVKLMATAYEITSTDYDPATQTGTYHPNSVTVTALFEGNVSFQKWQYDIGSGWVDAVSGQNGITFNSSSLTISSTSALFDTNGLITIKCVGSDNTHYDTVSIRRSVNPITLYNKSMTDIQANSDHIALIASATQLAQFTTENTIYSKVAQMDVTAQAFYVNVASNYATKSELTGVSEELSSELSVTAEGIMTQVNSKVGNTEIISKINQSAEQVSIEASKINLNGAVTANNYFKINTDGSVAFKQGTVGNIHIVENAIYSGNKSAYNSSNAGFFLGSDGKFALGNSTTYMKWSGSNLDLRVSSLKVGGEDVATQDDVADTVDNAMEEVSGLITSAAQTATSYLYYSSNQGLVVGNGNAADGFNTQITTSGINFRYNATVLSTIKSDQYRIFAGTSGKGGMKLTSDAMSFYKPNGTTVAASIGADGLNIASGTLGGFHVTSTSNTQSSENGGHIYRYSLYRHAGDGVSEEYEAGIKADADENPQSAVSTHENLAFYVSKITKGANWSTASPLFYVRHNGEVYCSKLTAEGDIVAKTGFIGERNRGFTIGATAFYNGTSSMSSTTKGVYVGVDGVRLYSTASKYVNISDGKLTAKGVDISGTLTATLGQIGGWTLSSSQIYTQVEVTEDGVEVTYKPFLNKINDSDIGKIAFGVSRTANGVTKYPFRVNYNGKLKSTNAEIEGKITSEEGKIGGWDIGQTTISAKNITLDSDIGRIYLGSNHLSYLDKNGDAAFKDVGCDSITAGVNQALKSAIINNNKCEINVPIYLSHMSPISQGVNAVLMMGYPTYDQALLGYPSSSSKRYKNVQRLMTGKDIENAYNITPVMAEYKEGYLTKDDERYGVSYPMFIAENIEEFYPYAVDHINGVTETWNERVMIPIHHQMLIEHNNQINALMSVITSLQEEIQALKQ